MLRLKKSLLILALVMVLTVVFFGCDRKGSLNENKIPSVTITTYEGEEDQGSLDLDDPSVFQQTIRWSSDDEDGVVVGYAYRVVNETDAGDEYLATPGNEFIQDEEGWIYHYEDGADESIPMDSDDAHITIWTSSVYAVINFPANINGESADVISRFDLKCIDNSGDESEIKHKYVNVYSEQSGISVSSTNGDIDGKVIGTGITLMFSILDYNNLVDMSPDHFEFKLGTGKKDSTGVYSEVNFPNDEWISTTDDTNLSGDISKYILTNTGDTYPSLPPNEVTGTDTTFTLIAARAIDIAGVISEIDTLSVFVSDMFYPSTLIFDGYNEDGEVDVAKKNNVWVLGENHYTNILSSKLNIPIPSVYTSTGERHADPFWIDSEGKFTAVNSQDLNIHVNWTWKGNLENDEVDGKQIGVVEDDATGEAYITDIMAFDLRLDGEAFVYPPLPASIYNVVDDNGDEWLRVYNGFGLDLFQTALLYGLENGDHVFEVRSFDLQGRVDPTPAVLEFTLQGVIPQEEKTGILIIDNDVNDQNYAPDTIVDSLYNYYVSSYSGDVEVIDYNDYNNNNSLLHFDKTKLALTDLQKYKLVIWHRDYSMAQVDFLQKQEFLINFYLQSGGNLVISSTNRFTEEFNGSAVSPDKTDFWNRLGFPIVTTGDTGIVSNLGVQQFQLGNAANLRMHIMRSAVPMNSFTQELSLVAPEDMFNLHQQVSYNNFNVYGSGLLSYFDANFLAPGAEVIYELVSKPANEGTNYDITDEEYEMYNNQAIAVKKITDGSSCYTFGAPLSYFDKDDVKAMIEQIITEVGL